MIPIVKLQLTLIYKIKRNYKCIHCINLDIIGKIYEKLITA